MYLYLDKRKSKPMKRKIFTLCIALIAAVSAFAATPAGSYDEELHGASHKSMRLKHQVDITAGFIAGGKLNTKDFGKVDTNLARPFLDVVYGARFNKFLFAGLGVGVQYAYGDCDLVHLFAVPSPDTWGVVALPLYANVKGYYPVSRLVAPYITLGIGHNFVLASNFSAGGYGKIKGGLFCKFGAGLTIGNFNLSLGLASQSLKWINPEGGTNFSAGNNAGYIEVGVTF